MRRSQPVLVLIARGNAGSSLGRLPVKYSECRFFVPAADVVDVRQELWAGWVRAWLAPRVARVA
jgi:hypothetical protein